MRENKFRAWDTKRKKMWSAEELGKDQVTLMPDGQGFINVSGQQTWMSVYLPHLIPLQYTTLKDVNGKEIYKDTIIEVWFGEEKLIYVCDWYDEIGAWVFRGNGEWLMYEDVFETCKIIGNIHENPKLIK